MPPKAKRKRRITNVGGMKTVGPVSQQDRSDAQAARFQSDVSSGKLKPIPKRRRQRRRGR